MFGGSSNSRAQLDKFYKHHHDGHHHHLPQLDAVVIRDLTYEAGSGKTKKLILNKINLTIPEGSIYGLLGPSGCGKTTMLRCLVGRIKARSGAVLVFGFRPGQGLGQVPGRDVGYMPQEISVYEDFTIEETLRYFAMINRMHVPAIGPRIDFLLNFLDLPSKRRMVANLSGGQKRRVSLAAALVHSPPLLILDEPTVGVDPLLRQSIWQHLVSLTQSERISVIITTHYIEEARQANVVGLMRHGRILAEASPDELMSQHGLHNLEDVFLKLCVTDSSRRAASLAVSSGAHDNVTGHDHLDEVKSMRRRRKRRDHRPKTTSAKQIVNVGVNLPNIGAHSNPGFEEEFLKTSREPKKSAVSQIIINTGTNVIERQTSQAVEVFSSEEEEGSRSSRSSSSSSSSLSQLESASESPSQATRVKVATNTLSYRDLLHRNGQLDNTTTLLGQQASQSTRTSDESSLNGEDYIALQSMRWASRRSNLYNLMSLRIQRGGRKTKDSRLNLDNGERGGFNQWRKTLMAVTWKNYLRLRRNPPVLVFQFMLPAIQVLLFCFCIGGDPFDVPVAVVNDELVPTSSQQFLDGLDKKVINQIRYDNLSSAIEAVRRGQVWGAIHIPARYSQNLQSRLIMGEDVTNETASNGTIRLYPDLTNLHLALALETTFRESFINFARNYLQEMGYDKSLADLPIQVGKPVYGSMEKGGYLEFMAPGVVVSISYVMATGLTALAFILERRDGLLERSLVSGVQTTQILLAHAINQVVVMSAQITLVLGCVFLVFEIPSRGPIGWVILLILLQGCAGMGFGLLVSAICHEENTAVMMLVGTFYTNLILAGIIWPIEAMPHWLRPLSYAQPQTLATESLRHILSRGWGITDSSVLLGFASTLGWLTIFLLAAGLIFKYSK